MSDPLWVQFPRWLLMSGLPQQITQELGPEAWLVFRMLIERDCERNLTPDWFPIPLEVVETQTGIQAGSVISILETLERDHRIECRDLAETPLQIRISEPIDTPLPVDEIRSRIEAVSGMGSHHAFRYSEQSSNCSKTETVFYLYQMIFGLYFTPHRVEELEQIAAEYDLALIYDIFSEAHRRTRCSFSWVRNQLVKRSVILEDEPHVR